MGLADTNAALALSALAWSLGESDRAERLLALTGLTPADLRSRADEPALLAAVLGFLEAHEPDLIACAAAIESTPDALVRARMELEA
ncbi:DUF3572 family protein [Flavisphingomonas formosensis]|uniref:DUF3572 family protein n=1 Tax=Flavisphingomonas formosensis TaxID=861534 RepID=UPI0012FB9532|nr:DUF3572 family protein [Sphingomonas formosensis]